MYSTDTRASLMIERAVGPGNMAPRIRERLFLQAACHIHCSLVENYFVMERRAITSNFRRSRDPYRSEAKVILRTDCDIDMHTAGSPRPSRPEHRFNRQHCILLLCFALFCFKRTAVAHVCLPLLGLIIV
jgi:hypothetical protein